MAIKPIDTLLALKALTLVAGLNASDRRVAGALLEHYNRKTGQCDPGLVRLAELLGVSTRTVIRSNQKLEVAKLFKKARHGGHSHRNRYEPNWVRFQELEAAWKKKFNSKSRTTNLSSSVGHGCHLEGDGATQTYGSNLSRETYPRSLPRKEHDTRSKHPLDQRQHRRGTGAADAAEVAAERRWTCTLHDNFSHLPITYGEIVEAITAEVRTAATQAEMRKRGAGFEYILHKLSLEQRGSAK
jgi:hypothetical protein